MAPFRLLNIYTETIRWAAGSGIGFCIAMQSYYVVTMHCVLRLTSPQNLGGAAAATAADATQQHSMAIQIITINISILIMPVVVTLNHDYYALADHLFVTVSNCRGCVFHTVIPRQNGEIILANRNYPGDIETELNGA